MNKLGLILDIYFVDRSGIVLTNCSVNFKKRIITGLTIRSCKVTTFLDNITMYIEFSISDFNEFLKAVDETKEADELRNKHKKRVIDKLNKGENEIMRSIS
jgi:hypothetical protein